MKIYRSLQTETAAARAAVDAGHGGSLGCRDKVVRPRARASVIGIPCPFCQSTFRDAFWTVTQSPPKLLEDRGFA
ncbi:MAG TPA: hypothetical protein VH640_05385, partial [Bryobacteraceae bacterium]